MGAKKSTSTAEAEPWEPAQPYLLDTMETAQNLFKSGPNTVAPFSNYTNEGIAGAANFARQPVNPIVGQASGVLGDTLAGNNLNGNPYLQSQIDQAVGKTADSVNSIFSSAGRYGSGAHQDVMGERVGDVTSDMLYRNYENERQNQLRSAQLAPQLAGQEQQLGMFGSDLLRSIGGQVEAKDQAFRMEPYDMLNWYSQIVNGTAGLGGTQTQTAPGGSRIGGALGGAAAGAQLGSNFGPVGTAAGGVLGAIGGFF